ncbi:hypothetical protein ACIB15232_2010 [Aliarcobacter cibarius]|uniref:hypothetical protein n=1 Tax=Aliarcobacter cibarius TaxID=255507 RepID=UPI0012444DEC|nr:hypothetical protein [Aliarcobacter cibarius]QEZ90091.1 hypothetical protein ACIB15232_2010 [Aliarcobacter cibarius]
MLGNIWISSALVVVTIFSTGSLWKSLSDIKEAKQIQEHYEIIKEIKTQITLKYNIDPENISRDDIIAHLPKGENWEKILLLDRNKDSKLNIEAKEFINQQGNIIISEDEKLKLLALKAKLKDIVNINNSTPVNGKYTFKIEKEEKNIYSKEEKLNKDVERVINFLYQEIIVNDNSISLNNIFENKIFFDYDNINSNLELKNDDEKRAYLKKRMLNELLKDNNSMKTNLYEKLKNIL